MGIHKGTPCTVHSFEYCLRDFALSLIALENLNIQPKISKKGQLVIGFNMLHRSFLLSFLFFTLLHISMAGRCLLEKPLPGVTGKEVGLIIVPGAHLPGESYMPLLREIQASYPGPLWIGSTAEWLGTCPLLSKSHSRSATAWTRLGRLVSPQMMFLWPGTAWVASSSNLTLQPTAPLLGRWPFWAHGYLTSIQK